ncbi:serine hydrolase domain-containing protein [Negadavirga shengliensis]
MTTTILESITGNVCKNKLIHGAVFHLYSRERQIDSTSACGNLKPDSRFYIASINKLFTSALTLRLVTENRLQLSNKITQYLPQIFWKDLVTINGRDFSGEITVQHLLSHTSGLPCYLIDKRPDGKKNMDFILRGEDQAWPVGKVVSEVKKMKPKFAPGTPGKASYGETNFRLLDEILQQIQGKPIDELYTEMFRELDMQDTEVLPSKSGTSYMPVYNKQNTVPLDKYFGSTHHDVASSAKDLRRFLEAYFSGKFYAKEQLAELEVWNNVFFPFKYGIGLQRFYIPRILSPFKAVPKIIGHCGSVGSIAFYVPEKSIYITGTVNQTANPSLVFRTMMKIIDKC